MDAWADRYKEPTDVKGGPRQLTGKGEETWAYAFERQKLAQKGEARAALEPVSGPFPGGKPSDLT